MLQISQCKLPNISYFITLLVNVPEISTDSTIRDSNKEVISEPVSITDKTEENLDEATLKILGEDPSESKSKKIVLQKSLQTRWTNWIINGLNNEMKNELLSKYSCAEVLEGQKLNPALVASLAPSTIKRDNHFIDSQNLIGSAMTALNVAISPIIEKKEIDQKALFETISDASKLLAEAHYSQLTARKAFITPGLNKQVKSVVNEIKTDKFLYGSNLAEKIKDAKIVEKAGLDMKVSVPTKKPVSEHFLNFRSSHVRRPTSSPHVSNNSNYRPRTQQTQQTRGKGETSYPQRAQRQTRGTRKTEPNNRK